MVMGRMTPPFPENCRLGVPDEACVPLPAFWAPMSPGDPRHCRTIRSHAERCGPVEGSREGAPGSPGRLGVPCG